MPRFKKIPYKSYLTFNKALGTLDRFNSGPVENPLNNPPIFILGAPRCGSTLIYQNLSYCLNVSYFSNRHCFWFGIPSLVERFNNAPSHYRTNPSFTSNHGNTNGWSSPSECAEYWYQFYERDESKQNEISQTKRIKLRRSFQSFEQASGSTLIIKNLFSVLRLPSLIEIFPEAIFVVVHRAPLDIAHSILQARKKKFGNYTDWFSLRPPNLEAIENSTPEIQVVEQIRSSYEGIKQAEDQFSDAKFYHLKYETFCSSPNKEIENLVSYLNDHGASILKINDAPEKFDIRKNVTIDQDIYAALTQYLNENPIML